MCRGRYGDIHRNSTNNRVHTRSISSGISHGNFGVDCSMPMRHCWPFPHIHRLPNRTKRSKSRDIQRTVLGCLYGCRKEEGASDAIHSLCCENLAQKIVPMFPWLRLCPKSRSVNAHATISGTGPTPWLIHRPKNMDGYSDLFIGGISVTALPCGGSEKCIAV